MTLIFVWVLSLGGLGLFIFAVVRLTSDVDPNKRYLRPIPPGVYDGDYQNDPRMPDMGGLRDQRTWD